MYNSLIQIDLEELSPWKKIEEKIITFSLTIWKSDLWILVVVDDWRQMNRRNFKC